MYCKLRVSIVRCLNRLVKLTKFNFVGGSFDSLPDEKKNTGLMQCKPVSVCVVNKYKSKIGDFPPLVGYAAVDVG